MKSVSNLKFYDVDGNYVPEIQQQYGYISGSHGLDWEGIEVEYISSGNNIYSNLYLKDYYFYINQTQAQDFTIDKTTVISGTDDIFILPKNTPLTVKNTNTYIALFCFFSDSFLKNNFYDKNIQDVKFNKSNRAIDSNLVSLVKLIYAQAMQKTPFADPYLQTLFKALATYYICNYSDYGKSQKEGILSGKDFLLIDEYIKNNIENEITSDELAKLCNLSNYTFLNEFKSSVPISLKRYIMNIRIEMAKDHLLYSNKNITQIACLLGYSDASHFSKDFKKFTQQSPIAYRNYIKNTKKHQ